MKIDVAVPKNVNVKTLKLHMKVCGLFTASLEDEDGDEIHSQEYGYVPSFMPGQHSGYYLILDIDIDTGAITNWKDIDGSEILEWINGGE